MKSQKFDKKWGVEHRYGHNSIFQKMELRLSYFDATISGFEFRTSIVTHWLTMEPFERHISSRVNFSTRKNYIVTGSQSGDIS